MVHANGSLCVKPDQIQPPKPKARSGGVYKWVDEHGKVHFGDKPTDTAEDLTQHYQTRRSGMELVMDYPNWVGSKSVEADLQKEAELMYRIFTRFIPKEHHRPVSLNITLFEDNSAYTAYRDNQGISAMTGAFYRAEEHRIYMPMLISDAATRAVARHEMTHAMTIAMLGTLPIWLMEGIAEYMQRLHWNMSAATVPVDHQAMRQAKGGKPSDLRQLTGMTHQRFYASNRYGNYARASLLVHFLIDHTEGQSWLKQTLASYATDPCHRFQPDHAFATYSGGVEALSASFDRWLDAREHLPHRY